MYVGKIDLSKSDDENLPIYTCVEIIEYEDINDLLMFETMEGITQEITKDELKDWEDLVYTYDFMYSDRSEEHVSRAVLYVDGKMADISSYEQQAETVLEDLNIDAEWRRTKLDYGPEYDNYLKQITTGGYRIQEYLEMMKYEHGISDNYMDVTSLDKDDVLYEDAKKFVMLRLAVQDAYDKYWSGEVSKICLVSYSTELDYMAVRIEVVQ